MNWSFSLEPRQWLLVALIIVGIGLLISLALLTWVVWRVRKIKLPADADILTALRLTPLAVVLLLDMLDFSLDFLAAPFAWGLLGWLGLSPLRGVTVMESLIPGTQLIPTMTAAWLLVRFYDRWERSRLA